MARIEFYIGSGATGGMVASLDGDAVPRSGEYISIRKVTYLIARVTWAVDHADEIRERELRACVELEKQP